MLALINVFRQSFLESAFHEVKCPTFIIAQKPALLKIYFLARGQVDRTNGFRFHWSQSQTLVKAVFSTLLPKKYAKPPYYRKFFEPH